MRSNRFASVLSALAIAALASACTSDEGGMPQPVGSGSAASEPTSESSTSSSPPDDAAAATADLEPCDLLAKDDLAKFGTFKEPSETEEGGARACEWVTAPGTGDSVGVSVDIRDNQSVKDVNDQGMGVETAEVNGREMARIPSQTGGCTIALGVGDSARVDVRVATLDNQKSCRLADEAAQIVEPKLPEG